MEGSQRADGRVDHRPAHDRRADLAEDVLERFRRIFKGMSWVLADIARGRREGRASTILELVRDWDEASGKLSALREAIHGVTGLSSLPLTDQVLTNRIPPMRVTAQVVGTGDAASAIPDILVGTRPPHGYRCGSCGEPLRVDEGDEEVQCEPCGAINDIPLPNSRGY